MQYIGGMIMTIVCIKAPKVLGGFLKLFVKKEVKK